MTIAIYKLIHYRMRWAKGDFFREFKGSLGYVLKLRHLYDLSLYIMLHYMLR